MSDARNTSEIPMLYVIHLLDAQLCNAIKVVTRSTELTEYILSTIGRQQSACRCARDFLEQDRAPIHIGTNTIRLQILTQELRDQLHSKSFLWCTSKAMYTCRKPPSKRPRHPGS